MFLFDPTFGNTFENCEKEIRRLMDRAQAEILVCRKWDERRLAYRIKGRKRGVYVLVYFKAPPDKISSLERDVRLSEPILRVLVLRAGELTREDMERIALGHAEGGVRPRSRAAEPAEPAADVSPEPDKEAAEPTPQDGSPAAETATADPSKEMAVEDF
jgi:small subunit ribosomal protein S6